MKKKRRHKMDSGLRLAIRKAALLGNADKKHLHTQGKVLLAEGLGIKVQSINNWHRIPRERVMMVHIITGIPLAELAPDLFKAS